MIAVSSQSVQGDRFRGIVPVSARATATWAASALAPVVLTVPLLRTGSRQRDYVFLYLGLVAVIAVLRGFWPALACGGGQLSPRRLLLHRPCWHSERCAGTGPRHPGAVPRYGGSHWPPGFAPAAGPNASPGPCRTAAATERRTRPPQPRAGGSRRAGHPPGPHRAAGAGTRAGWVVLAVLFYCSPGGVDAFLSWAISPATGRRPGSAS